LLPLASSGQIEAISVHDLGPGGDKVLGKLGEGLNNSPSIELFGRCFLNREISQEIPKNS
jgi:hypothetical protein